MGSDDENALEVFSWWKAPGEADALQALVNTYKGEYPDARVSLYDNTSADTWQDVLAAQISDSPWDVFQMSASDIQNFTADHPGDVLPVDQIFEDAELADAVIPEILESVMVDGVPHGVVTGVHRNNSFLFNLQILDEQGIAPPETIEELLAACEALDAEGITPVATTFQSWALRIMFDEILAGTMGAEGFYTFVNSGEPPADQDTIDQITSAVDTFDLILTTYVDVETSKAADYGWDAATATLHSGDAAMLFHGDWAKGYLVNLGFDPGVDFGVSGPPGAFDLFVYGADMFGFPAAAPHPQNALDFLSVVASKEGQVAFNRQKGSTPMRTDVREELDEPGQLALDNLINAKVLMKGHPNADWDAAFEAYSMDGDKDALLEVYLTATP
jgi:glucose/mannose transport system substrate-binding protein